MKMILPCTLYNSAAEGYIIKKGKLIYSEIVIQASSEKVWEIFSDFAKYPEWTPFIK